MSKGSKRNSVVLMEMTSFAKPMEIGDTVIPRVIVLVVAFKRPPPTAIVTPCVHFSGFSLKFFSVLISFSMLSLVNVVKRLIHSYIKVFPESLFLHPSRQNFVLSVPFSIEFFISFQICLIPPFHAKFKILWEAFLARFLRPACWRILFVPNDTNFGGVHTRIIYDRT